VKLLVATRSADKLREIRAVLRSVSGLTILDLNDAGVEESPDEDGIEVHETFADNATAKARYFHALTGLATVADDSGLCVDALDGRPGVHSRRFSPDADSLSAQDRDKANNEYLLSLLGDLDLAERTAHYVCVAALVQDDGDPQVFEGRASGLILGHSKGYGGFGYDPLFFDQPSGKTYAELSPGEKQERSHRGEAFRKLARFLETTPGNGT
jgi:XTP/dITP diphosphohydrolase